MLRDFFLGFIRLHILHHANESPVFGLEMIKELEEHGYRLSPGTMYPILHGLEGAGYLKCHREVVGGKVRKYYSITPSGTKALAEGIDKAEELLDELRPRRR